MMEDWWMGRVVRPCQQCANPGADPLRNGERRQGGNVDKVLSHITVNRNNEADRLAASGLWSHPVF